MNKSFAMPPAPRRLAALALVALASLGLGKPAQADGGAMMPRKPLPAYTAECASCHVAYPPGLLPAASWQRMMGSLDKHYGSNASLDAATTQQISLWLQAHGGTYKRVSTPPPQDRITLSAWFERKHRQIEPATWKLDSVKRPANCGACHNGADRGWYDDDQLKLPAGLSASQRRNWTD